MLCGYDTGTMGGKHGTRRGKNGCERGSLSGTENTGTGKGQGLLLFGPKRINQGASGYKFGLA